MIDIDIIKQKVRLDEFFLSNHAEKEAEDESIDIAEIKSAILNHVQF